MDPWNAGVNNEKIIRRLYMHEMALDTQCIKRGSQLIPTHDDPLLPPWICPCVSMVIMAWCAHVQTKVKVI